MAETPRSTDVFINCPFDDRYKPLFDALVFVIHELGFVPRCAREADDSGEVRLTKIERIIEQCKYGIHDISEVGLDAVNKLPRFNMPLELGMFFGCKRFGATAQRSKVSLILDIDPYRYQKFISDIAGHDIRSHEGSPDKAIVIVRNWLVTASGRTNTSGGPEMVARYRRFSNSLPRLCRRAKLDRNTMTFVDLSSAITSWLSANR